MARRALRVSLCVAAALAALGLVHASRAAAQARAPVFAAAAVEGLKRLTPEQRYERRFLQETAAQLRFMADASRLALARSDSTAVRELAGNLLQHEKSAQQDLLRLLYARGMAMPMLANGQVKLLKQLGRAGGAKFDRLFLQEVGLRAQAYDLRTYERMAQAAQDPALRSWAEQQLPGVRWRLQLAERAMPGADRRAQGGRSQITGSSRVAL